MRTSDLILGYPCDRFVFHSAGTSNNIVRAEVKLSTIFCPCVCFLWPKDTGTVLNQRDCSLPFAKKLFNGLNSVTAFNY